MQTLGKSDGAPHIRDVKSSLNYIGIEAIEHNYLGFRFRRRPLRSGGQRCDGKNPGAGAGQQADQETLEKKPFRLPLPRVAYCGFQQWLIPFSGKTSCAVDEDRSIKGRISSGRTV
jgi:hypothetical protein